MKFGAIDIGTNAARLLIGEIVEYNNHKFVKKISYTRIPLKLGYEVFETGEISKKKQEEFIKTIQAFKLISEIFEVKSLRACATSAMREAKNGKEIQKKIKKETGVKIEIIDGEEEGDLILNSFELIEFDKSKPYIVIDVGGGSTEISMFKDGVRQLSKSFEVGTIRLLKNKVKDKTFENIQNWIELKMGKANEYTVFATGGNINKIHKLFGLQYLEPLKTEWLLKMLYESQNMSVSERIEHYNLKEDRAAVIVPALQIYTHILEALNVEDVLIPKIGLSDGIVYDLYMKEGR